MLVGRGNEQRRIDALLDAARHGTSGALVLVGEPGIGKTALLEHAAASAAGFGILRARGVQSEAELAFGALLELCRPILDRLEQLEPNQADALRATLGLSEAGGATPFAIGAATLSLLAAAAEDGPVVLIVDDAHWLDPGSADAMAFAVRRLRADAVVALFGTRPGEGRPFSGRELPELELEGLDDSAAGALLGAAHEGLDGDARARMLELAHGNPLALLELPRHADVADEHPEPARIGKRLEQAFRARADLLSEPTRRALVVAASASTSELGVLQRALEWLDLPFHELEPAEAAGLVSLDAGQLTFRHPLVRSALYHAADRGERRRAHAALAEFERSLELHALDENVFATARTRLAYGERLRRSGRRLDAREQLNEALDVFERLEAAPWAERARSELRATGQRVRARKPAASEELTAQELQVALLVAEGKTNREVGAQLFLSPKTIEWHLGHVYRKLGIVSRAEIARMLGTPEPVSSASS